MEDFAHWFCYIKAESIVKKVCRTRAIEDREQLIIAISVLEKRWKDYDNDELLNDDNYYESIQMKKNIEKGKFDIEYSVELKYLN